MRPSTLPSVFFIGGSGCATKGGFSLLMLKILNLILLLDVTPDQKIVSFPFPLFLTL